MTEKSAASGKYTLPNGVKITARIKKEGGRYFAIVRGPGGEFETEHKTHKAADRKLASRLRALGAKRRANPDGVGRINLLNNELEAIAGTRASNPDPGNLPPKAARMLAHVYASELDRGLPSDRASAAAWAAVKREYYKGGGKWRRRKAARKKNPSRPPVAASKLQDLSEHGNVLDLVVRQGSKLHTYAFGRTRPLLAWSPEAKALVWWEGVKMPAARRVNASELPAQAAATWERFHGAAPKRMRVAKLPDPGPWKRLGPAVRIGYRNPKRWGKDDAEHDFTSEPVVYRAGARAPYLWLVRGGKLRMTARGIEG